MSGTRRSEKPATNDQTMSFASSLYSVKAAEMPVAAVKAFSVDDATTTEIDDAFSLTLQDDGVLRLGIHIAAPALIRITSSRSRVERCSGLLSGGQELA